jgi:GT2 family glycosyltransferase
MKGRISTLILNRGKNMGVGHGMNRGFSVARGKWVCKLDVDLTYTPGWIEAGIELLSIPNVAVAGFFDYKNYVPDDSRFEKIYPIKRDDTLIGYSVTDFVGSSFMIRRKDWLEFGVINGSWRGFEEYSAAFAEDVEWKLKMQEKGYKLAITPVDYHQNFGFGLGKSTVVVLNDDAQPEVAKISDTPLLFGGVKHV